MPSFDAETQQGLKALDLATKHAAVLDPRLPAGHRASLTQSLSALGVAVPEQLTAKKESIAATVGQVTALDSVATLISGFREAVKHDTRASAKDRKDFGVGARIIITSPKTVFAVGAQIAKAAKENLQRAIAFGITPADLAKLDAALAAAKTADTAQDVKRAKAPDATKARNAALKNVIAATRKIGGVGVLAFAIDAATRAEFEALLDGTSRAKKAPPKA